MCPDPGSDPWLVRSCSDQLSYTDGAQIRNTLTFGCVGYKVTYIYSDYTHTGLGKDKRKTAL